MESNNLFSNERSGKGVIGALTGLLGIYLSAAMWVEFNEALGALVGSSIGVIIGMVVFLLYQTKKNEREFTSGGNYTTSESTSMQRDSSGRMQQIDSNMEKGRNPVFFLSILYGLIILISEVSWSNLLF